MQDNEKEYKEKDLNNRELKLIKNLADGLQPRQAALNAGYAKSYVDTRLKNIISKDKIQKTIQRAMKAQGLTEGKLMENLSAGMEADKTIICNGSPMDVPDWSNRRHYLRMALDLLNAFPDKAIKVKTEDSSLEKLLKAVADRDERFVRDITPNP